MEISWYAASFKPLWYRYLKLPLSPLFSCRDIRSLPFGFLRRIYFQRIFTVCAVIRGFWEIFMSSRSSADDAIASSHNTIYFPLLKRYEKPFCDFSRGIFEIVTLFHGSRPLNHALLFFIFWPHFSIIVMLYMMIFLSDFWWRLPNDIFYRHILFFTCIYFT